MNRLRNIVLSFGKIPKIQNTSDNVAKASTPNTDFTSSFKKPASTSDQIGPVDKISNIRTFRYYVPEDESKLEYDYRMLREKVFEFNNDYWTQQNLKFLESKRIFTQRFKMREQYMNRKRLENSEPTITTSNADIQLNEFYKQFLNENYHNHIEYNRQWYKYNFMLLKMSAKVNLYRFTRRKKKVSSGK